MKKHLLFFITVISITLFSSCEKEEEILPEIAASGSKEHYMPLSIGNSWTYDSEYYGKYTISVTGTETKNDKLYFTLQNSLKPSDKSYMIYEGNKLISLSTIPATYYTPAQTFEMLLVNEDAKEGQSWLAGEFTQTIPSMYSFKTQYICTYKKFHSTYTHLNKVYNNVMEIELKTTICDFTLLEYYDDLDEESRQETIEYLGESLSNSISQTQFFAKGIGYVYQYSEQNSRLNIDIDSYTIK